MEYLRRKWSGTSIIAVLMLAWGASGCFSSTSEATFIDGRDVERCDGVWQVCKGQTAGCVLDENRYIEGSFPGQRKFLVRTIRGDWTIRIKIFLRDRLSPGTETEVAWYEPGCTDQYKYSLSKEKWAGDLFEQAGPAQVFEVEHGVVEEGDHLVTLWSDAVCRYKLRLEILRR